jgi:hypothetical protein
LVERVIPLAIECAPTGAVVNTLYSGQQSIVVNSNPNNESLLYDCSRDIATLKWRYTGFYINEAGQPENTYALDSISYLDNEESHHYDAHWAATMTYDYFLTNHYRSGLNTESSVTIRLILDEQSWVLGTQIPAFGGGKWLAMDSSVRIYEHYLIPIPLR